MNAAWFERADVQRWLCLGLLLLFGAQVLTAARETSLTSDEGPQLTSAYTYLITGDAHLIEFDGHPPLAKIFNTLPLLPLPDLPDPATLPDWNSTDPFSLIWVTQQLIYPYRPLDRLVIPPRVMTALLGLLLLALIYRWARDLFGPRAGLGALFLAACDPNLLAHAGLATNDLAVTLATLATLFTLRRALRRPTPARIALAGLILGVAQSTKLSAMLLLPVAGAVTAVWWLERGWRGWRYWLADVARFAAILLVAGLALWATYGFEVCAAPGLPFPIPACTHVGLWARVSRATGGGHPSFLMGQISRSGWWYYFPVAFVLKTPLPTLLALLGALGVGLAALRQRVRWGEEAAWGIFAALYTASMLASHLNIGYRHLLPLLPLLYVGAARVFAARVEPRFARAIVALTTVAGVWLLGGTLAIWPFHLAYFNELIGGPDQGYRYLVDSNTDWGQTLKALRRYMDRESIDHVNLSTYIEYQSAFAAYGLQAMTPLPPLHVAPGVLPARFNPAPGVYAISTTTLQGIFTADPEMYDWFRKREPDARIGHVQFIYKVTAPPVAPGWVAQCSIPATPLSSDVIAAGFGRADLRVAAFDCTQSWLTPESGRVPGWYAFFRDTTRDPAPLLQTHLARARLSFEQRINTTVPPFALYESAAPLPPQVPAIAPTQVGPLLFLGHTAYQPDGAAAAPEIWTFWQVTGIPDYPLSLMLHLLDAAGTAVAVGDGLGAPPEHWRVGDHLIQRHRLDAPPGEYTPQTGAYRLDTLERLPITVGGQPAGDSLRLAPVTFNE